MEAPWWICASKLMGKTELASLTVTGSPWASLADSRYGTHGDCTLSTIVPETLTEHLANSSEVTDSVALPGRAGLVTTFILNEAFVQVILCEPPLMTTAAPFARLA